MPERALQFLVVEDETLVLLLLEDLLTRRGHSVHTEAASLADALAALERDGETFNAALLDVNLGGELALPVAHRLEALGIPYVIVSGYERSRLIELGFTAPSLTKPLRSAAFDHALERLLDRTRG